MRKTYGFTKEKAERISLNTENAYKEKYGEGINPMSYCVLYEFHKDPNFIVDKLKIELSKFNKTYKLECAEDKFSTHISYTEYNLDEIDQLKQYEQLKQSLTMWHRRCTDEVIEREKNNAKI